MSEEIVACPGCAKKFRIPDGAAPNGAFDCTACGAAVTYGSKPAGVAAGRPKRPGRARGKGKAAARGGAKGARAAAKAEPAKAAGGRGRRARRGDDAPEQPVQKGPPMIVPILCGVVVLAIVVVMVLNMKKPKEGPDTAAVATGTLTTGAITATDPGAVIDTAPEPDEDPTPVTTQPAKDPDPAVGGDSGIGGKEVDEKPKERDERYYWYLPDEQLFVKQESTPDTTPAEREEIDRLVTLMCDMASAREGMRATDEIIEKWGKKAIPSMLSTFVGQTWDTQEEQFAAYQVQLALRAIVKADLPRNKDFVARFTPQMAVPKEHFKSAAKMWISHWLGNLRDKDEFKEFEEEEE